MIRVILESPFAGEIERNILYARRCIRHSLSLNEAPIASHLLYTQPGILDDNDPEQRRMGIDAGHAWLGVAQLVAFYVDYGMSPGMELAALRVKERDMKFVIREIGKNP